MSRLASALAGMVSPLVAAAPSLAAPSPAQIQARMPAVRLDGGNLFEVLARHRGQVAMIADRTYTEFDESQRAIRYQERVLIRPADDKNGIRFNQSLTRISGNFDAGTLKLKKKRYSLMAGTLFQFRDFRIHDPALARKNYFVVPMGAVFKLGRVLRVFDIYPKRPGLSLYRISVDAEHNVVLDQLRLSNRGYLQSVLSYGTLKLGKQALFSSKQSWWTNDNRVQVHRTLDQAAAELVFTPVLPKALPRGYRLHAIKTVFSPANGKKFLELAYSDGIDIQFLIQSRQLASQNLIKGPRKPELTPVANLVVKRFRQGLSTQFWANYKGIEFLALTTGQAGLPRILKSVLR
ncbi:MAG: hypothetical protein ACE5F1_09615 [Planctomycetota bacterium]